jgi:hypothetical protein
MSLREPVMRLIGGTCRRQTTVIQTANVGVLSEEKCVQCTVLQPHCQALQERRCQQGKQPSLPSYFKEPAVDPKAVEYDVVDPGDPLVHNSYIRRPFTKNLLIQIGLWFDAR